MLSRPTKGNILDRNMFMKRERSPVWIVTHRLNKDVIVQVFDETNSPLTPTFIDHVDLNTIHLHFAKPEMGRAIIQ